MLRYGVASWLLLAASGTWAGGEDSSSAAVASAEGFQFTDDIRIDATPVKNQARTGTCWAFATVSFLEAELIRGDRGTHDLSEMFLVRHVYPQKAQSFIRWHGTRTFGPGSLAADALRIVGQNGLVPEPIYDGKLPGHGRHDHEEMDRVLRAMLDAVLDKSAGRITPAWQPAVEGVLDAYLRPPPEAFEWQGQQFTPATYARSLGLRSEDYVHLTSFTHHPFGTECVLELPDNWAANRYWNVPLPQLMRALDHALQAGHTVIWDGDVSEPSFQQRQGVAVLPRKEWESRSKEEKEAVGTVPEPELRVTQALRQQHFDSHVSTDDHLMHVVGTSRDQHGTRYYVAKNSWGTLDSKAAGHVHMSTAYVRAKTISITLHRDALPARLRRQLRPAAAGESGGLRKASADGRPAS